MIPTVELSKLADLTVGFVGTMAAHYRDEGVPFLRSLNVKPHRISTENLLYVDPAFEGSITKSRLREGDVVIVRTGKPGDSAVIPAELGGANCSDLVIVRPRPRVDPRWLSYSINAATHGFVRGELVGAVQQHFNVKSALRMPIPDFSFAEQRAIGEVLGALDDKIAANMAVARAAVQLQEGLWGKAVAHASTVSLTSVAPPVLGGTPSRKDESAWGGGVPWLSVRDLTAAPEGIVLETAETISHEASESARRLNTLPAGSIILSARGTVGQTAVLGISAAINQSAYGFVPKLSQSALLRIAIDSAVEELQKKAHGSVFSTITMETLHGILVPDVFGEEYQSVAERLEVLEQRRLVSMQENQRLAATRDELLPLLISGKITVKDAEKTVEEVV